MILSQRLVLIAMLLFVREQRKAHADPNEARREARLKELKEEAIRISEPGRKKLGLPPPLPARPPTALTRPPAAAMLAVPGWFLCLCSF